MMERSVKSRQISVGAKFCCNLCRGCLGHMTSLQLLGHGLNSG